MPKAAEVILYQEDGWTTERISSTVKAKKTIKNYAYILHDKDVDDATKKLIKPHFHVYLSFGENNAKFCNIAGWFGVNENCVERVKGGKKDMLLYLYHGNAPEKHQYSVDDIVANFDVKKALADPAARKPLDVLIEKCAAGEITPYNYVDHIPAVLYARHKSKFENAWKFFEDSESAASYGMRNLTVIWIYGQSGAGKTTLAKLFAAQAQMALYITSQGKNPFDNYASQPICVMDEIRPDDPFSFTALLQLLDPYTDRSIGARYRDRRPCFSTLFITTLLSPYEFYQMSACQGEDAFQLYRRISEVWHVQLEQIEIQTFSNKDNAFITRKVFQNPVKGYLAASVSRPARGIDMLSAITEHYCDEQLCLELGGGAHADELKEGCFEQTD